MIYDDLIQLTGVSGNSNLKFSKYKKASQQDINADFKVDDELMIMQHVVFKFYLSN